MKVLLILCIQEYVQEVRNLLKNLDIPMFSEIDMEGFKRKKDQDQIDRWFSGENTERASKLILCIQTERVVDEVMQAVQHVNQTLQERAQFPIHAYQLTIEEYI
ncbi:MAG: hypothetical protein AAFW89_01465 [Bacteroidota bacterium]